MHLPTQRHAAEAGTGTCTMQMDNLRTAIPEASPACTCIKGGGGGGQAGLGEREARAGSCSCLQRRFQTDEMRPEHHRPDGQDSDLAGCQVGTTAATERFTSADRRSPDIYLL